MLNAFFLVAALTVCNSHQAMVDILEKKYHELLVHQTVNSSGNLLEIFRSENGRTWTIVLTIPRGLSCIIDTGNEWKDVDPDWLELDPET